MRNAWFRTIAALLAMMALTGSSVFASPAGMAVSGNRTASPTARATTPSPTEAYRPSAQYSPTKQPFKYFTAAMSELPIVPKGRAGASPNPVMQPTTSYNDSIALNQPVGPPAPELIIAMAQACERQGNIQQARNHYVQGLTVWPGHVEMLRAAARMEDKLGQLLVAESLYQQVVALNPQHAGALNDLGLCLARQGKLDASLQAIEQAVHLQPDKALFRNNAAIVLVEMRQEQRALGHLAAVHGPAEANYNLGQVLVQRGRAAEAAPFFETAIEQNPQMQQAHVALAKMQGRELASTATLAVPNAVPRAVEQTATPQMTPNTPQFNYPATARTPDYGASSQTLPSQQVGPESAAQQSVGVPGPARYLPPVASQPGAVLR